MSDGTQHAGRAGVRGHEKGLARIGYPGKLVAGKLLENFAVQLVTVAQGTVQSDESIELGPIGSVSLPPEL